MKFISCGNLVMNSMWLNFQVDWLMGRYSFVVTGNTGLSSLTEYWLYCCRQ